MHEIILHIDDDQDGLSRVDGAAPVVADTVVGIENQFSRGAAREVEAFRRDVVVPLVVAAKGDMFGEVVGWGWDVFGFGCEGVDEGGRDGGWGHVGGRDDGRESECVVPGFGCRQIGEWMDRSR